MSDLDLNEQNCVRTALRNLHRRTGTWATVAAGLRVSLKTLNSMLYGERLVTAGLALRVARLMGSSVEDLLGGRFLANACPHCGHVPEAATTSPDRSPRAPFPPDSI